MGAEGAPRLRAPLRRGRAWLSRSLTNRVTAAALALSLGVALVLGGTSFLTVRSMLTHRIEADLEGRAVLLGQELASSLNGVARDLQGLAASSLVANGLVDSHGRDAYLTPFLREHEVVGAPGTELVLCDFRGRPIASNLPVLPEAAPEATSAGPAARIDAEDGTLVLVFPVIFPPTGQSEGTLLARVALDTMFLAALRSGQGVHDASLVSGEVTVVAQRAHREVAVAAERALALEPPLDGLGLRVILAEDASALTPVRRLAVVTVLAGVLALVSVAAAARQSARGLTRRLAGLSEAAREIAAGARTSLPGGAGSGGDEVDTVAGAFNATLEKLRAIQESLEQKVAERTADLVEREQELQRSREQLALAVEGSHLAVWRWELATGEVTFGEVWPELLGYAPGEVGRSLLAWAALVHPDDRERVRADVVAHVKGLAPRLDSRFRIRAKNGSWRWIQARGRVVEREPSGRARSLAGTHADVTELEDLHHRMFEATRLASVGTLAAGVAHEINNPLSYLSANLTAAVEQLAAAQPIDGTRREELSELLEDARDGARRIAAIVRAMRTLGDPDRAGTSREVDVRAELESAVQMVRNQLVQRARLELELEEGLPPIRAQTSELGRVFLNLLVNAAQAIPEGRPEEHRIAVSARARGDAVVVEVSDTGAGIPAEVRARIFEPFFTTKPVGAGMGLGLPIAASIVESAGGKIEVDSRAGGGSTFRVILPAGPRAPAAAPRPETRAPAGAPGRRRVLVIDDEPLVRRALLRQLAAHHDVEALDSAAEALRRVEAGEQWDVILCDLMMTGTDGIALYEALHERHPALAARLGFVTGGAFGERATRFLAGREVVVVTKPATQRELLRAIERLAGPAAASAGVAAPAGAAR